MIEVKQIKTGCVDSDKKNWILACSSVTLIKENGKQILVDSGGRGFFGEIKKNLEKEGVSPEDISLVINTHCHLDHVWNNAFFENAEFINSRGILKEKFYWKKLPIKISKDIEVIYTPGHSEDSCSVIVRTNNGNYAITGDLFYGDIDKIPSFEKNVDEIKENRKNILEIADFVIPGHGEMFPSRKV